LQEIYEDTYWLLWKFGTYPGFWEDEERRTQCVFYMESQLGIMDPKDWYGITYDLVYIKDGGGLLRHAGGISNTLCRYPDLEIN
jgi:hypothetical protein